jgi:hypothetical protein
MQFKKASKAKQPNCTLGYLLKGGASRILKTDLLFKCAAAAPQCIFMGCIAAVAPFF